MKRLHPETRRLYLAKIEQLAEEIAKAEIKEDPSLDAYTRLATGYARAFGRCQVKGETILGLVRLLKQ